MGSSKGWKVIELESCFSHISTKDIPLGRGERTLVGLISPQFRLKWFTANWVFDLQIAYFFAFYFIIYPVFHLIIREKEQVSPRLFG